MSLRPSRSSKDDRSDDDEEPRSVGRKLTTATEAERRDSDFGLSDRQLEELHAHARKDSEDSQHYRIGSQRSSMTSDLQDAEDEDPFENFEKRGGIAKFRGASQRSAMAEDLEEPEEADDLYAEYEEFRRKEKQEKKERKEEKKRKKEEKKEKKKEKKERYEESTIKKPPRDPYSYHRTPLITGVEFPHDVFYQEEETPEQLERRKFKRACCKSMLFPYMLGMPASCLLVGTMFIMGDKPKVCELPLYDFIWWSRLLWIYSIFVSMGCFADGFKTTRKDVEQLPFGKCCLPLLIGLCCAIICFIIITSIGMARYLEASNTEEPAFACTGPYMRGAWWIILTHFTGLSAIVCAVVAVVWF